MSVSWYIFISVLISNFNNTSLHWSYRNQIFNCQDCIISYQISPFGNVLCIFDRRVRMVLEYFNVCYFLSCKILLEWKAVWCDINNDEAFSRGYILSLELATIFSVPHNCITFRCGSDVDICSFCCSNCGNIVNILLFIHSLISIRWRDLLNNWQYVLY